MNIGFAACTVLAAIFAITALVFALLKEKGAILIGGFTSIPKEQRAEYDQAHMSRDMRNTCLLWAAVMAAGAALSLLASSSAAIIAFAVWLVLFFKDVRLNAEQAFERYKTE